MLALLAAAMLLARALSSAPSDDPFAGLEQAAAAGRTIEITVARGESLTELARRYYVGHVDDPAKAVRLLEQTNRLKPGQPLILGAKLRLPYPFETASRQTELTRATDLDKLAQTYYGYAPRSELWWPLLYRANRATVTPGGRRVKKGERLVIPALPIDIAERMTLARTTHDELMRDFRRHLESGESSAAGEDRFLLLQGTIPLLERGVGGLDKAGAARERQTVEGLWSAFQAERETLSLAGEPAPDSAPRVYVDRVVAAARKLASSLGQANVSADPELSARLGRARQKLEAAVRRTFAARQSALAAPLSVAPTPAETAAAARACRSRAFESAYLLSRLSTAPGLDQAVADLRGDLGVAMLSVPTPPAKLPAMTQVAFRKDPTGKRSMTVAHPQFDKRWLPMAAAYARGLWTSFPEARNAWGRPIAREEVIKAIVIHESRGVHRSGGAIIVNRNGPGSTDLGFAQINDMAHRGLSVDLARMSSVMDAGWTVDKLASRDYLDVPKRLRSKPVTLVLTQPVHNLVASVTVLSYSLNRKYARTASHEEQLVKSLSAYNHGAGNPDYAEPWLDFVGRVDPKKGEEGELSAVCYGIGMKMYLGMTLDAEEVDWWARRNNLSVEKVFQMYVDPYYSYAHFP